MDKIRNMSIVLKYVFWVMLISIPLFEISGWWFYEGFDGWLVPDVLLYFEGEDFPVVLDTTSRLFGFVSTLPYILLDMYCMWQMVRLFTLYSEGRIFSPENSQCYRRAAWAMLAGELIHPFVQAGVSYAISMDNPVGERFISISIDHANIGTIVVACVILAVSWVMDEGRRLQDEAELTI